MSRDEIQPSLMESNSTFTGKRSITYSYLNPVDLSPRDLFHRSASSGKRNASSQGYVTGKADCYLVSIDYDRYL
jgi:hypothetical protein